MALRLDKQLLTLLSEGKRKTALKTPELIRRTLRRHLREVIEAEAAILEPPLTSVAPWRPGALTRAYHRAGKKWDRIEAAAVAAQPRPSYED